jgi:hypothetical protein
VAYAVASGQDLLNWQCERRGRAPHIDGELPGRVLQERLKMLGPISPDMLTSPPNSSHCSSRPCLIWPRRKAARRWML